MTFQSCKVTFDLCVCARAVQKWCFRAKYCWKFGKHLSFWFSQILSSYLCACTEKTKFEVLQISSQTIESNIRTVSIQRTCSYGWLRRTILCCWTLDIWWITNSLLVSIWMHDMRMEWLVLAVQLVIRDTLDTLKYSPISERKHTV